MNVRISGEGGRKEVEGCKRSKEQRRLETVLSSDIVKAERQKGPAPSLQLIFSYPESLLFKCGVNHTGVRSVSGILTARS